MSGRGGGRGRGGARGGAAWDGSSGRGRGRMSAGSRPVDEGLRIDISQILRDFQENADEMEMTFPPVRIVDPS